MDFYTTKCETIIDLKKWIRRKAIDYNVIGRMYLVNPSEGERYYLRLLQLHVRGEKSNNQKYN